MRTRGRNQKLAGAGNLRQAEEILRLSEGYRLYAAPEDTFLAAAPAA